MLAQRAVFLVVQGVSMTRMRDAGTCQVACRTGLGGKVVETAVQQTCESVTGVVIMELTSDAPMCH